MAKLVLLNSDEAGREYELVEGQELVLGRNEDCDIVLANVPGVSRRHAAFNQRDGLWVVSDLGSHNGIYRNQKKLDDAPLEHGDILWFSNAQVQFIEDGKAPPPRRETVVPAGDQLATGASPAPKLEDLEPAGVDADEVRRVRAITEQIGAEMAKVIVGQKDVIHQLLVALLANGHCLMLGLPGLAKTLMISTLSEVLDLKFKRIQFTPDLMPSDIVGSDVLEVDEETGQKSFRFLYGPVFTNMLLADEINRTPPKTQAALLEAMQERHVSAGNQRFPLPDPFFVLATQNPLEQEGTYPLPEAQLDRFMFMIVVDYPAEDEEEEIVHATTRKRRTRIDKVLSGEDLLKLQDVVRELPVSRHVVKYATRLARATRPGDRNAPEYIREYVACGAGPRAAQYLILGAKAEAILNGRLNVSCEDVRFMAPPVLRHRIYTNFTADSENVSADDLVTRLLLSVTEPSAADYE